MCEILTQGDVWWTTGQVGKALGLTRKTVRSLIENKRLTGYQHGRDWRIKRSDVLVYLERVKCEAEAQQ